MACFHNSASSLASASFTVHGSTAGTDETSIAYRTGRECPASVASNAPIFETNGAISSDLSKIEWRAFSERFLTLLENLLPSSVVELPNCPTDDRSPLVASGSTICEDFGALPLTWMVE